MKVKFKTRQITKELIDKYVNYQLAKQDFHLDIDQIYLVFGLYIQNNGSIYVECLNKYNHLNIYPLDLFEIVDGRMSKYWLMKIKDDGEITILPKEHYDNEHFHEDLSDDNPDAIVQKENLIKRIYDE